MKIQPVPGRLVRDPVTGREITEPTVVLDSDPFWIRRVADGDVAIVEAEKLSDKAKKGAE